MADDILTQSVLNSQFRDAYTYDIPVTKDVIYCDGCPFTVIGEHKSHWGDIYTNYDLGYLSQTATVTIVNPDYHADTSFVTLFSDKYMECRQGEFRAAETPQIRVVAYPRDTTTPADVHLGYAHDMSEAVPSAYFLNNSTDDWLDKQSLWKPHEFFLTQEIKGGQVAPWGVGIQRVRSKNENFNALDTFLNANILSTRPKIRGCFRWLVGTLCDPQQINTPIRSDVSLTKAYVEQRRLTEG
ncbi:MAG: hypothetical protein PHW76_06145 [Alphaproteobacteria bacterium]|nr:hypothetical protein [Alphaproteobacteria bacterium]